ncbi:two-pore potassium channel 1-like [Impatiens glandulifera]|uniref:two-pore potassium channel 1-like n=1 Tax=Impatiens glandulifera TaxID=253017 RepID=UPI001FB0846B|nr:two-pore potassium channel 1-like [Impatiens glandulifera]XP_047334509.1 two-pore potassium channel 1-like [Impatiens glandulifera]
MMADSNAKQPLLSGSLDQIPQTNKNRSFQGRRIRRSKSASRVQYLPPTETKGVDHHHNDNDDKGLPHKLTGGIHTSFRKVMLFLAAYLGIGTVCFYLVRNQISGQKTNGILDAVYFCIVTMTTVGYGDLVPSSVPSKLLACVFVFSGTALVGFILSNAADYLVEKQEALLVKTLHHHNRQNVDGAEIEKEMEANKAKYKCLMVFSFLLVMIVTGTIFLVMVEKLNFVDAFYCVCSTITTLGYGDKSFSTKAGRIFAVFWILTGTILLGQFFLSIAEMNTERRQQELAKWVLRKNMTSHDIERADLDSDGVVGAAEFVIYKLKEMGKISQEDVSLVMEEFKSLDLDQSGTISDMDIKLAQTSRRG